MLNKKNLDIVGSFNPDRSDNVCSKVRTILLIGAKEFFFGTYLKKVANIGIIKKPHLIDSQKKTIEEIAIKLNASSFFPFEAPFQTFIDWAKKCSTMGSSPFRLLVHKEKGLLISFRGALEINEYIESPNNSKDICTRCEKPCLTAYPVSAFNQDGYDVIRCKEYLDTPSGQEYSDSCLVRRSCHYGQNLRPKEHSNFHMRAFLSD